MVSDRNVLVRLSGWARTLVLRETGEAVELVHIEEIDDCRRAFVELSSGLRTYVPEAALTSRVTRVSEGALLLAGVAVAGTILGYTLNPLSVGTPLSVADLSGIADPVGNGPDRQGSDRLAAGGATMAIARLER